METSAQDYQVSTIRMTLEQWTAVRREAAKRAEARGTVKADVSEVLRELVDAWRSRRK